MNEWMVHLYGSLLCIAVHPKRFASTRMMQRLPQDTGASALTTHQLQVERRERVIEPIKCMRSPHTSYRWRGERVIESIKCMLSPHTSYRWRGERVIETIKCMLSPHTSYRWRGERVIETIKWIHLKVIWIQSNRFLSFQKSWITYRLTNFHFMMPFWIFKVLKPFRCHSKYQIFVFEY